MATFVLFGVTGDLARNKIVPAVFGLYARGEFSRESFSLMGVGRKKMSKEEFHVHIGEYLAHISMTHFIDRPDIKGKDIERLKNNFILSSFYVEGKFDDLNLYNDVKKHLEMNIRDSKDDQVYCQLAVPPTMFEQIIDNMITSQIMSKKNKSLHAFHLLIDKPFGHSASSAKSLHDKIVKNLSEKNLVLIDHYLAKDSVIKLRNLRKTGYLENFLNDKNISEIEVVLLETKTLVDRGIFHDSVGSLYDVGQNHLLQVLSTACGDVAVECNSKFISNLSLDIREPQIFAQYRGYLQEKGVNPDSKTETYFSVGLKSGEKRWRKTKFRLTSGKAFAKPRVEIRYKSRIRDGYDDIFSVPIQEGHRPAYELVFLGVINHDINLRAGIKQIMASWKLISTVKKYQENKTKKNPDLLKVYKKGSESFRI